MAQQLPIDTGIVLGDLVRCVREVELDGSTTTGFEVDEQRPVLRGQQIARVWFTVQQLLGDTASGDLVAGVS